MLARSPKALLALFLCVCGAGSYLIAAGGDTDVEADPPKPASTPMAATMIRVGLDAEVLAAAGVSALDVSTAMAAAISEHDGHQPSLSQADSDYGSCKVSCDALERKVKAGLDSGSDVADYQSGIAELATLKAARQKALDDVFESAIANLSAGQQTTLQTIRANRRWKLPVQYLTVNREEAEWVELRDMLDARRIYEEDEFEDEPQEVTDYLAAVDGHLTIAGAKSSLASGIAAVQTAWNTAVTE